MIEGIPVGNIGAGGLVILSIWMIFTGRLVPRRYYDELAARLTAALEERDNWRKAAESLNGQNKDLLANADLSLQAWTSIKAYVQVKEGDLG